jgi:hypothetical protein
MVALFSFSQSVFYGTSFGGPGENRVFKSTIDKGNNIYLAGYFTGTVNAGGVNYTAYGGTGYDIFVSKYDENGNFLWFKQIGSSAKDDYADGLTLMTRDSILAIVGGFSGASCDFGNGFVLNNDNTGTFEAFLVTINTSSGVTLNAKKIAYGKNYERPQAIKEDKNENLVIIGFYLGLNSTYFTPTDSVQCIGPQNYFFLQLDKDLNLNWVKTYRGNNGSNKLFSLDVDNDGYYIAGTNKDSLYLDIKTLVSRSGSADMFLYKTDFNGNGQWIRSVKGSSDDFTVYATCDRQGHVYLSGYFASTDLQVDSLENLPSQQIAWSKGSNDIFFAKYTTGGELLWYGTEGSTGDDRLTRLNTNGKYIVIAGQFSGPMTLRNEVLTPRGGTDGLSIVYEENDNLLYAIPIGGSGTDVTQTCVIDSKGNYIFMGNFYSPVLYLTDTYTLTNPTPGTRDVFIAKYDKASISISVTPITCNNADDGIAVANPKGAWYGNVTISWTKKGNPAFNRTGYTVSNLSPGTYYCQAVDELGYSKVDSFTLTNPVPVAVSIDNIVPVSCYGGSDGAIAITPSGGTGPYTYLWSTSNGGGLQPTQQNQTTLRAGTYAVTVTDSKGCFKDSPPVNVTQPQPLVITVDSIHNVSARGAGDGAVFTTASGGTSPYSYLWTPGNFTTGDIMNLSGNVYSVVVTDSKGCTDDTSAFVFEPGALNVSYTTTDVSCFGGSDGSIDLTVSGDYPPFTFSWKKDGLPYGSGQEDLTSLSAGTYEVTVCDNDSPSTCRVVTIVVSQPPALNASTARTNITCYGSCNGLVNLTVSGGTPPYTYTWTKEDDAGFSRSTEDISSLCPGIYHVTITDSKGCAAQASDTITEPSALLVTDVITDMSCYGGTWNGKIDLTVNGGTAPYTYQWSNGMSTEDLSNLKAGTYCVTVRDANNCSFYNCYTVNEPLPFNFSLKSVVFPSCFGYSDGSVVQSVTGGNPPYSYQWNTGETGVSISGKPAGTYWVNLTDSKGCQAVDTTVLLQPDEIQVQFTDFGNVTCFGANDGHAGVSVTGGTPPYTYLWTPGNKTTASVTGLAPDYYSLRVRDNKLCQKVVDTTITQPSALSLTEDLAFHADNICYQNTEGQLMVHPSGGHGTYEFSVDGLSWQDDSAFVSLQGGTYAVKVRDKLYPSCIIPSPLQITIARPPQLVFHLPQDTIQSSSLDATPYASGGTPPYTFDISPAADENPEGWFSHLNEGVRYVISVNDANNCGPVKDSVVYYLTAVHSVTTGKTVTVYPNPFHESLTLVLQKPGATRWNIELVNALGQTVYQQQVSGEKGAAVQANLSLGFLPAGMYFLKVREGNTSEVLKVVRR